MLKVNIYQVPKYFTFVVVVSQSRESPIEINVLYATQIEYMTIKTSKYGYCLLLTVYIVQIAIMKMCDERCFKNCWGPPSSTLKIEFDSPSHNSCSCIYSKQQFCDLPHLSSTTHYIVYNIKLVDLGANCCELAYVLFSRRVTLHRVTKHILTCMWMGQL